MLLGLLCILALVFLFWPFINNYLSLNYPIGDEPMHFANILLFKNHHPFPVSGWQGMWYGGYPILEGYPWLHYYLIQPFVSFFGPQKAMDYYSIYSLLLYFLVSFLLFLYVSKNKFFSLLLSVILMFGSDAGAMLFQGGFFVFVASQFFLPLVLLTIIAARERENNRLLMIGAVLLALSYYAHSILTLALIIPAILPFLIIQKNGAASRESLKRTIQFFLIFSVSASLPLFQQASQFFSGAGLSGHISSFSEASSRFASRMSLLNPVLIVFVPFLFLVPKKLNHAKPFIFSLLFMIVVFILMVLNLTPFSSILFPERVVWAISLTFLLVCALLFNSLEKKAMSALSFVSIILVLLYVPIVLIFRPSFVTPKGLAGEFSATYIKGNGGSGYSKPAGAFEKFDNYRMDGLDYTVFAWWNTVSQNPRYAGWYPALKGLKLDWSGLVSAGEQGRLGAAGSNDNSESAKNQTLFFFDWYGIRYLQSKTGETMLGLSLASYLESPPLIQDKKTSGNLTYYSLDPNIIGPIYAPSFAATMAIVAPQKNYDNLIRTLSYTKFSANRLIPIYLGSNLASLKKEELLNYDSLFLYGYKRSLLSLGAWSLISDYVKNGGNLIIETGQKVGETEGSALPEVFPVSKTIQEVINSPWSAELEEGILMERVDQKDFKPLSYNYLPFSISAAKRNSLRTWARPVVIQDENIVVAYGEYGKGKVFWSGLNLPFHAVDTRNVSEAKVLENVLNWFFPQVPPAPNNYSVEKRKPEEIVVRGKQAKGVLIKENYDSGWEAKLNGSKTKIYKAGLFLMYVPVKDGGDFELRLEYTGKLINWFLFFLTVISLVIIGTYLVFSVNLFKKIYLPKFKFKNRIKIPKTKAMNFFEEEKEY